jgi:hypothetical protein
VRPIGAASSAAAGPSPETVAAHPGTSAADSSQCNRGGDGESKERKLRSAAQADGSGADAGGGIRGFCDQAGRALRLAFDCWRRSSDGRGRGAERLPAGASGPRASAATRASTPVLPDPVNEVQRQRRWRPAPPFGADPETAPDRSTRGRRATRLVAPDRAALELICRPASARRSCCPIWS